MAGLRASFSRLGGLIVGSFVAIALLLALPTAASAFDEFPLPPAATPPAPAGITVGPDGAIWFTEEFGNKIGRLDLGADLAACKLNPAVCISEFSIPTASSMPAEIITGPDGRLWFTESTGHKLGRLDPAACQVTPGACIVEFPTPTALSGPDGITVGPDGKIWFTEGRGHKVGRIDPADTGTPGSPKIDEFAVPTANSQPGDIVTGPDGRLWFTEGAGSLAKGGQIGAITTGGAITEYVLPTDFSDPSGITSSFGALWFTQAAANKIGRISTTGIVTEFPIPTPASGPSGIKLGADGALWFTEQDANKIGRMTTGGSFTEFIVPTPASQPSGIVAGPDRALWFTQNFGHKIGRIETAPPFIPPPPPPPPAPKPVSPKRACKVPEVRGLTTRKAARKLRRARCRYRMRGKGRVYSTSPRAGRRTSGTVRAKARRKCKVPTLRGSSVKRAKRKLLAAGCGHRVRGKGKVVSVSPREGSRTKKTVRVRAKR